jgi:hypothetical protein
MNENGGGIVNIIADMWKVQTHNVSGTDYFD